MAVYELHSPSKHGLLELLTLGVDPIAVVELDSSCLSARYHGAKLDEETAEILSGVHCRVTLSRSVPYFSRLKSRISRIVAQKRESNPLPGNFDARSPLLHKLRCSSSYRWMFMLAQTSGDKLGQHRLFQN